MWGMLPWPICTAGTTSVLPACRRVHFNINVHGRHVDVTPELEAHVKGRLVPVINKFRSPAIVESEGGVKDVDIRLMWVCRPACVLACAPLKVQRGLAPTCLVALAQAQSPGKARCQHACSGTAASSHQHCHRHLLSTVAL
jgi:hypothetical protein